MRTNSEWPVAVIGAGVAGLSCARSLHQAGFEVAVFEAGSAVGGRCSAIDSPFGQIDVGSAFLAAQHNAFLREVDGLIRQGSLAPWHINSYADQPDEGSPEEIDDIRPPRRIGYVGVPSMAALPRQLARGLKVHTHFAVHSVEREDGGWFVAAQDGRVSGPFGKLVFAMPAPRLRALVRQRFSWLEARLAAIHYDPCWVLAMAPRAMIQSKLVQRSVSSGPIRWIGAVHRQPGRSRSQVWILHAAGGWSAARAQLEPEQVCGELLELLQSNLDTSIGASWLHAHFWPQAFRVDSTERNGEFIWDDDSQVGVCGDSLCDSSVEAVYLSGQKLAFRIFERAGRLQAA